MSTDRLVYENERPDRSRDSSRAPHGSLLRLSPGFILLMAAAADAWRVTEPGLWGRIHYGQAMLSAGQVVRHDPYSYSVPGHLWIDYEWLTEVLMALAYDALGVFGLKLLKFACTLVTISFLALGVAETGAPLSVQKGVLRAVAVALMIHIIVRPTPFTFPFFAALMWLLAWETYRGHAPIWLAAPMLALWANVHGGFVVGLMALGTYSVAATLLHLREPAVWKRMLRLGATAFLATLATLLNPYGLTNWYGVVGTLHNPLTRYLFVDFQPLLRGLVIQWSRSKIDLVFTLLSLAILCALVVAVARTRWRDDAELLAVAAVLGAATIYSVRNLPLAAIASVAPLARHWARMTELRPKTSEADVRAVVASLPNRRETVIMSALAVALAVYTGLFTSRLQCFRVIPVGAVMYMREHRLHGNVLCEMEWGEYLIGKMAPATKVFVDGRFDTVYPVRVIQDDLDFCFGKPRAKEVLNSYPHDFVLIPYRSPGYEIMIANADWKLIYRDPVAALFSRKNSRANVASPEIHDLAPPFMFP